MIKTMTEQIIVISALAIFLKVIYEIAKLGTVNIKKERAMENYNKKSTSEKIAPFIEIHLNNLQEFEKKQADGSIDRLKDKIENFKYRNRFYEGTQ